MGNGHEQRAGCCAEHPLIILSYTVTVRHARRLGGHSAVPQAFLRADTPASPAAQKHAHPQPLVHRAQLSVWRNGACRHQRPSFRARYSVWESGAPWHLPPLPRAQPAHHWGLRGRSRRSRGSDDGGRQCAGTNQRPRWRRVDTSGQDSRRKHTRPTHTCGGKA
jgi:hypothetical protein